MCAPDDTTLRGPFADAGNKNDEERLPQLSLGRCSHEVEGLADWHNS